MKALSIRQPWASMIICGYKPVENRTWRHSHRGPLLIHSSQKYDREGERWILANILYTSSLAAALDEAKRLRGGIIGKVNMTDCVEQYDSVWFFGQFGFVFERPESMGFIEYKGQLRFFDVQHNDVMGRLSYVYN